MTKKPLKRKYSAATAAAAESSNDESDSEEEGSVASNSSPPAVRRHKTNEEPTVESSADEMETLHEKQSKVEKEFLHSYLRHTKEGRKMAKSIPQLAGQISGDESKEEDEEEDSSEEEKEQEEEKKKNAAPRAKRAGSSGDEEKAEVSEEEEEEDAVEEEDDAEVLQQKFIQSKMEEDKDFRPVACQLLPESEIQQSCKILKNGHRTSLTRVVISYNELCLYSADREGTIVKWCLTTFRRLCSIPGGIKDSNHLSHTFSITGLDVTRDDQLLVSADSQGRILMWDTDTMKRRPKELKKSRYGVTALKCHRYERIAFSGHSNGSIFIWSLTLGCMMEELHEFEGPVLSLDMRENDRLVGCSGNAGLVYWKISLNKVSSFKRSDKLWTHYESVTQIGPRIFITGDANNSLAVFHINKQLCRHIVAGAHPSKSIQWIGSVASLHNSDLLASGAGNGEVKLWQLKHADSALEQTVGLTEDALSLTPLMSLAQPGYINSLCFSETGKFLAVGVGCDYGQSRILPTQKRVSPHIYIYQVLHRKQ